MQVWTIVLSIWLGKSHGIKQCDGGAFYIGPMAALLGTCVISVVFETCICYISAQGSLFETEKRRHLSKFIYCDFVMFMLRIAAVIYGTVALNWDTNICLNYGGSPSFDLRKAYLAALWSNWAIIGGAISMFLLCFNFFPVYDDPEVWKRQFVYVSTWFCCIKGTNKEINDTFRRIGEMVSLVLGNIDLTLTDALVMFYLMLNRQRFHRYLEETGNLMELESIKNNSPREISILDLEKQDIARSEKSLSENAARQQGKIGSFLFRKYSSGVLQSKGSLEVPSDGLVDVRSLQSAAHFMKFAFASYGWMLYVWAHAGKGIAKLCCGRRCGCWEHVLKGKDGIPLDIRRAPYLNREAILQASGLAEKDLLFVRYEDQVPNVLPYYIAIDHEKKCLVIAIRGSMSFDDVVRDLKFDPVDIDDWLKVGVPWDAPRPQTMAKSGKSEFAAHNGMFEAAVAIVDDLKAQRIVENQLLGSSAPLKDYDLVLCGHSLGAGCAFLVGIHLRCYFPTLKCYSFSPPGALVSSEIAEKSRDWCISTVCGKEMIPRMTLNTIETLRDDMVHLGTFCRKPKFQLILSWITGRVWSDPDLYYSAENLPEESHQWMELYERNIARKSHLREVIELADKFEPPGRVMYLKPTGKLKSKQRFWGSRHSREYVCEWTTGTSIVGEGILLTGRMMKDHMPDYSYALLKLLAEQQDLGPVFVDDTEGETLREEMERISAVNMDEEVKKV